MKLTDMSFKQKIIALLILPILGFLWLSVSAISKGVETTSEMSSLNQLTRLSVVYSELVHELQKERGMTAGFIGSQGTQFVSELRSQRASADTRRDQRSEYWQSADIDLPQITKLNTEISRSLNQITSIRNRVDSQSIPLSEALGYYTQLNAKLLSVSALIAELSSDATITTETIAYYNFLQGKERAGIERAVLNNTFSKNEFGPGMLVRFISLMTEQNTYFSNFKVLSTPSNVSFFEQQLNDRSVAEVEKLRQLAQSKMSGFDVDPVYWFAQSTARIVQLKKTENQLADSLIALTEQKTTEAQTAMMASIAMFVVITLFATFVSFKAITDLTTRVKDLTLVLSKVRDDNDLTVRATYVGSSELGQISLSLNETLEKFSQVIDNLSQSSLTLASAAEETAQTCQYNSNTLVEQQNQIGLIATATEELSATVNEVAAKTQQTATSAKMVDQQSQEGLSTVQHSYESIEILASEINGLAEKITHLHESSNNINSVIDVIKSVADQTNLLALNAAIEAARAGEQGRGFAVVADEVRTLAQRTQESTLEIEGFISSLQSDVQTAFNVIDNSKKMSSRAVEDSRDVEQTLQDISGAVSEIFSMTEQIATATEEQAVVTQDIAQNVVAVEQKSTESTTGATQIAATAKEQAELATSLKELSNTFKS
ncbi:MULTISPECIES: methyl-accepting chemotaxis protein [Vibrio]|uniref:Chemotaxis protein n=5 Tax=Vibrio cyclitrophicus TaxID=47951 RepID=A0A7Z1S1G3_9VIBR|nr:MULTISPECIES: methyl-accepting chemotaxis protein [Vibrio]KNH10694.1 chemotaxis protein [Vibrio lentus]MBY7659107.1 methyl-accepting chemotaxis protein [Vibrio atlanticus]ERM57172.1 Methyl-accepting chemotaxis protein [Vibrio cyclitrophicus FF75]KAA8603081.1 Methyl-accepting chemotaxis sensor/transducer protein [Vibrio cyclitrophicus]MBE8558582.1 methyl-accepting chemotaxis protein [Vibrio sp. OPT24]|tara:strand:+ start:2279 stop:4258 length:1980 start_codon:yes stop_codon:yes gene_type:complete